jgi:lysophospholipase L1-like esterase
MVLCPIPTLAHVFKTASADDYRARFAELAEQTGVELIDLLPALWQHPVHVLKRSRFPQDEHPNRLGHQLLADALAPHLERLTRTGKN